MSKEKEQTQKLGIQSGMSFSFGLFFWEKEKTYLSKQSIDQPASHSTASEWVFD